MSLYQIGDYDTTKKHGKASMFIVNAYAALCWIGFFFACVDLFGWPGVIPALAAGIVILN